ncbi:MAG: hypothetical protein GX448_20575 [Planctomycetes bacterium]|nr:hypothetical protein [Planctomycetota bacterium]
MGERRGDFPRGFRVQILMGDAIPVNRRDQAGDLPRLLPSRQLLDGFFPAFLGDIVRSRVHRTSEPGSQAFRLAYGGERTESFCLASQMVESLDKGVLLCNIDFHETPFSEAGVEHADGTDQRRIGFQYLVYGHIEVIEESSTPFLEGEHVLRMGSIASLCKSGPSFLISRE